MIEMKNILEGINSRLGDTEHSSDLEDRIMEIIQSGQQKEKHIRAFLVVQWLRIRLPTQGTRVRALVREDPTCHRATKPVRHNY